MAFKIGKNYDLVPKESTELENSDLGKIYMYTNDTGDVTVEWSDDINDISVGRNIFIVAHNVTESEYDLVKSAIGIYSKL